MPDVAIDLECRESSFNNTSDEEYEGCDSSYHRKRKRQKRDHEPSEDLLDQVYQC